MKTQIINLKRFVMILITLILGVHLYCSHLPKIITVTAESLLESITAKSCVVMDAGSGDILLSKAEDKRLPIASMVKLMTVLLTLESIDDGNLELKEKIVVSKNASGMGGSQVFLDADSEYTVEDLLKSTIVASANDASVALAEAIAGSEQEFVEKMNARAESLGMANTHYANATGLPAVDGYSSAEDVAKLLREVLTHQEYYNYSTIWMDDLVHPSGRITGLSNTNKLIRYYKGCDAGKTGSTSEAGYCVASSAKKNDMRVIAVVIGAESGAKRFSESASLLDWTYANFENKVVFEEGQELDAITVKGGRESKCVPIVAESFSCVVKKGDKDSINYKIEVASSVSAPLDKGDKIGTAYVIRDNVVIKEIDIIASTSIARLSYFDALREIIK